MLDSTPYGGTYNNMGWTTDAWKMCIRDRSVPSYAGWATGDAYDPDFFDTATTNPKNENNPKGVPGYQFLGWHWTDLNGNNHYSFDYYDATGTLIQAGEAMPTTITNQSYTCLLYTSPLPIT